MSHEIESMFYEGAVPWHKLGKKVERALTAKEAIVASGLDWLVETVPIFHRWKRSMVELPENVAIRRVTDGHILGVGGTGFTPIQNVEGFNFFDDVVASKEAKYHTAGSLMQGKRVWILAKVGKNGAISIKGDRVDQYLLLVNGHDGTSALKMFFTPIRVVCNNTLTAAKSRAIQSAMFYARHTEGIKGRVVEARDVLGITLKFYEDFTEKARHLARVQLPAAELPKLLTAAFTTVGAQRPEDALQVADLSQYRQDQFATVTRLFEGAGKGLDDPKIKGTKWAAYNAVTEFVDYGRKHRGDDPDDVRLRSVWMGSGAKIKKQAWDYLLAGSRPAW